MHPAYSVILFTTSSGAGYGLLFWLSLAAMIGTLPNDRWLAFTAMALALILITAGLLASTLHLGHPERSVRAFSQWRSSWLSREGVVAIATYVPAGLLALIWLTGADTGLVNPLALLVAVGAAITVYCTGMIYASLRTIRQWNLGLVPIFYLAAAAATGALILGLILALFGYTPGWVTIVILLSLIAALWSKLAYWRKSDGNDGQYTVEMATALGSIGKVRPLDPPHTRPNFVMREMGYKVARKHAKRLRWIASICLFALPILIVLLTVIGVSWPIPLYLLAVLVAGLGILIERWLFFAEAEHVSMLYYGAGRA